MNPGDVELHLSGHPSDPLIVGRTEEWAVLASSLARAQEGRPHAVVIEGEPGMGKSALLEAFLASRRDIGALRWVRCAESEQGLVLGVAGLLLGDDGLAGCSRIEAGRRLLTWLGELQAGHDGAAVLAVDDAQWMDRASAEALRFAVRRLRADSVLCLIARRPRSDAPNPAPADDPSAVTVLHLGPLGADAVRDMARLWRSWELPAEVAEQLVNRTGGVPLLAAAVVRGAREPRQLEYGADLPATAAAAANRMLGSVDEPARRLVEASAVLVEATDLVTLGNVADVTDPSAAASTAAEAGLVTVGPQGSVACAHVLLREAVHLGMALVRRRELHAKAAEWTTGDRSLAHRVAATDRPDPRLVTDLLDAARAARGARCHGKAATHLLHARAVCGHAAQRETLLLEALIGRVEAQDLTGARELETATLDAAPGPLRSLALGLLARDGGDVGAARTWLREAVDQAHAAGERRTSARAALAAAILHVRLGEGAAAAAALADADPGEDPELAVDIRANRALGLWHGGDLLRALDTVGSAPVTGDGTPWDADLVAVRGMLRMYAGQLYPALDDLDTAVRFAHLWRPSTNQSRIYVLRSVTRYHLGDWDGASIDAAAARALAEGGSQGWSAALALAVSAAVPAGRGQFDVATGHLDAARRALADLPGAWNVDVVLGNEIALAVARDDHGAVLETLEPVWSEDYLRRAAPARSARAIVQARVAALAALGRTGEAATDLRRYEATLCAYPEGPVPARLGWLRGLIAEAQGQPQRARQHYADDLADPHLSRSPFVLAQVLLTSGRLERTLGEREEAIDRLTRAGDLFAALHAVPFLQRCRAELAACRLTSPRVDPLALTAREQDVTALVQRGYSNKQVAAELFLTSKTVEYHLGNIYAKLRVRNRHELRRMHGDAERDGRTP